MAHRLGRPGAVPASRLAWRSLTMLGVTFAAICAGATPARPTPTWSLDPATVTPGGSIAVRSGTASPCEWWMPDGEGGELHRYDGTTVEVHLRDPGDRRLGALPVREGGAWSGRVRIPAGTAPGRYGLWVRCLVDHPDLDGRRSFDFDPRPLRVMAPPATTTTTGPPPTTLPPPPTTVAPPPPAPPPVDVGPPPVTLVADRPAAPAATLRARAAPPRTPRAAPAATLPDTGSDLRLVLAGLGALGLGALRVACERLRRPGTAAAAAGAEARRVRG